MTPAQRAAKALREAADTLESFVVSDEQAAIAELMGLCICRLDASPRGKREAELLIEMMERAG